MAETYFPKHCYCFFGLLFDIKLRDSFSLKSDITNISVEIKTRFGLRKKCWQLALVFNKKWCYMYSVWLHNSSGTHFLQGLFLCCPIWMLLIYHPYLLQYNPETDLWICLCFGPDFSLESKRYMAPNGKLSLFF